MSYKMSPFETISEFNLKAIYDTKERTCLKRSFSQAKAWGGINTRSLSGIVLKMKEDTTINRLRASMLFGDGHVVLYECDEPKVIYCTLTSMVYGRDMIGQNQFTILRNRMYDGLVYTRYEDGVTFSQISASTPKKEEVFALSVPNISLSKDSYYFLGLVSANSSSYMYPLFNAGNQKWVWDNRSSWQRRESALMPLFDKNTCIHYGADGFLDVGYYWTASINYYRMTEPAVLSDKVEYVYPGYMPMIAKYGTAFGSSSPVVDGVSKRVRNVRNSPMNASYGNTDILNIEDLTDGTVVSNKSHGGRTWGEVGDIPHDSILPGSSYITYPHVGIDYKNN